MNALLNSFLDRAKECYELKELERLGLTPDLDQREQILTYICLLYKWNDTAGLIPESDESILFLRHFCDSLQPLLLFGFKKGATVLNLGASNGFPSIPIRIFRPDLSFVLQESDAEKSSFLKAVKNELEYENIEINEDEVSGLQKESKKFDYVISREYETLQNFSGVAKPLVASDGHMYTFKTDQFANELDFITNNKETDGIRISEIAEYDLGNQIMGLNLVSLELVH
ncbi:16S rRNA (guanine(527)-N(7))-methyltransferase RsmG [Chitinispirillales bacterium ANBcel5]|uniref:16S rRNA (guanine(527)-N(7))-methyltransferase RsmG n=1 Tax=Cellulosispirillum alkaliphilum TaxID=3039283 RepID=UPI002A4EF038|nr:16S rRNA (guanine(527)-N(7))-methyltransferase RsmG [Chitinispirillales bacterium ANBcel5]